MKTEHFKISFQINDQRGADDAAKTLMFKDNEIHRNSNKLRYRCEEFKQ